MTIRCSICGHDNEQGASVCSNCGSRLDVALLGDPLIGRVLGGRYAVVSPVAEGGMGRVYLARQQMGPASRDVAVKVLHLLHSQDETLRSRFYRECEVVNRLTHPHTIQFYDFGELDNGQLFIVMEYIAGTSLTEALREGKMPVERVERLLTQICGSLHEAHEHGIVHRDLKPDNILLTTRGGQSDYVKVCDFGVAKAEGPSARELTAMGTVLGTPDYMSPEQLIGGPVDRRSDIFSLGLIVYEMLTGRRPFEARSVLEWLEQHARAEPAPLEIGLSKERKAVLNDALAKDPAQRPPSAEAFAARFIGGSQAIVPPSMRADPGPRPAPNTAIDAHAATMPSAAALQAPKPPSFSERTVVTRRSNRRSMGLWLLVALLAFFGVALSVQLLPAMEAPPAPGAIPGAITAGPPVPPSAVLPSPEHWIRIVHRQRRVRHADHALGPPDAEHAVIRPRGAITLELMAGTFVQSDGGPGPDLYVRVDDERSGPYHVDVAASRGRYRAIAMDVVGSLSLDVDQFELERLRYVRVRNRRPTPVFLDAVGAYRTTVAAPTSAGTPAAVAPSDPPHR